MKKKGTIGTCALCEKDDVLLEESHIIPKFVFRRIVQKSVTGFLRNAFNPNQRIQDGDKQYLLCGECEDLFNKSETLFANKVFHPFKKGNLIEFEYDSWLNYFIASVNWRNLNLDILDFKKDNSLPKDVLQNLITKEKELKDFLLGLSTNLTENHIFFFDDIKTTDQVIAEDNPHTFFRHSSFGYTVVCHDYKSSYVVSNLSGILICTILEKANIEKWDNTLVQSSGRLELKNQYIKSPLMGDIMDYMKESRSSQGEISKEQKEKVVRAIQKNSERYFNSEIRSNQLLDEGLKNKSPDERH